MFVKVLITKCIVRDPAQTVQQQLHHIKDYALECMTESMYDDFLASIFFSPKRESIRHKLEANVKSTSEKVFQNLVAPILENDPDVTGKILRDFRRGKVGPDLIDCPCPGVQSLFDFR